MNHKTIDTIFIGASTMIYHMDTTKTPKLSYNFGVAGTDLATYPAMVKQAIKQYPKRIVISLSVDALTKAISSGKNIALADLIAFINSHQPLPIIVEATINYIQSLYQLRHYSEFVYAKLASYYDLFFVSNVDTNQSTNMSKLPTVTPPCDFF